MARISGTLLVQLVDDSLVLIDESHGTEIVIERAGIPTLLAGIWLADARNRAWTVQRPPLHITIPADAIHQAKRAVDYLCSCIGGW